MSKGARQELSEILRKEGQTLEPAEEREISGLTLWGSSGGGGKEPGLLDSEKGEE